MDDGISLNQGFDGGSLDLHISCDGELEGVENQLVAQGVETLNNSFKDGDDSVSKFLLKLAEVDGGVVQVDDWVNWGEDPVGTDSLHSAHDLSLKSILDDSDVSRAQTSRASDGDDGCEEK